MFNRHLVLLSWSGSEGPRLMYPASSGATRSNMERVITRYHPVLSVPVVTIRGMAGAQETVTAAAGHPLARPGTTGMSSVQTTSIIRAGDFGDQQCWDGPVHLAEAGQGGDSQAWPPGSSPLGSSRGSPVAELAAARAAAATPAAASGA